MVGFILVVGRTGNDPVPRVLKGRRAANYTNDPASEAPVRLVLRGEEKIMAPGARVERAMTPLTAAGLTTWLPRNEIALLPARRLAARFSGPLWQSGDISRIIPNTMQLSTDNRAYHICSFVFWILIAIVSFIQLRRAKVPTATAALVSASNIITGWLMLTLR